jgi:hypothetical protein
MHHCRIHGLHTSQSGCPDCRYADYKQQKLVEQLEGSPNRSATPSIFGITSNIEDFFARLGMAAGALCGGIFGFVEGFKDGIAWALLVGAVGAITCAIIGGVVGAFLGALLPLIVLGMLIYVILRLLGIH